MQPSLFSGHIDGYTQSLLKVFDKRAPPLPVEQSHPPDMPREMTLTKEVGEHGLEESRRPDVVDESDGKKAVDKIGWHDHVTKPQGGKQNLAERSDINHSRVAIQSLQRGNRVAFVAKFAVVVVLDNP